MAKIELSDRSGGGEDNLQEPFICTTNEIWTSAMYKQFSCELYVCISNF
jgi:hypothetical protein